MPRPPRPTVRSFATEGAVYAGLVAAYVLLVLRYLGPWLKGLFDHDRPLYAAVALAAVIIQGAALEQVTHLLLRLFRIKRS
ncbi:MAG TPA: hypothetical protein VHV47_06890 [Opitutaceae bacterium]|jgi:hypothetical protein|nr:hypothetical protein [Opitutaceae bacterium]